MAAAEGHAAVVEFLVENGVAINVQDRCVAINVLRMALSVCMEWPCNQSATSVFCSASVSALCLRVCLPSPL